MKRIYLSPPDLNRLDRELVLEALESGWVAPLGPHVDAFEREVASVAGVPHAVALSSGTAALHLSLAALGVGQGRR
jgi:dTDP-4-amino-4,6-dideoxygalactose transaminase